MHTCIYVMCMMCVCAIYVCDMYNVCAKYVMYDGGV